MRISRRSFLQLAGIGALTAGGIAVASGSSLTSSVLLEKHTIPLSRLPKSFEGYRIGFITDVHAGRCVSDACINEALTLLKQEQPDLLLIGGDLIWNNDSPLTQSTLSLLCGKNCMFSNEQYAQEIYRGLGSLFAGLSCADGAVCVPGNHDNWASKNIFSDALSHEGVPVLVNEIFTVERGDEKLSVTGFDDYWTGIPRTPHKSAARNEKELRIALSHNPDWLSYLLRTNAYPFDLGLCGHTHGGQIKLPGIGALFYNIQDARLREGLVKLGETFIYTSRGVGTVVVPIRINCPPEVTVFTLTRA